MASWIARRATPSRRARTRSSVLGLKGLGKLPSIRAAGPGVAPAAEGGTAVRVSSTATMIRLLPPPKTQPSAVGAAAWV